MGLPENVTANDTADVAAKEAWVRPVAVAERVQDVTEAGNTTLNLSDLGTCAS